jgi:uncharacterized protein with PQ loop repeat
MDKIMIANMIGLGAAVLSSIGPIPQVIKAIKTKSVEDISVYTQGIGLVASSLFFSYGIMLDL